MALATVVDFIGRKMNTHKVNTKYSPDRSSQLPRTPRHGHCPRSSKSWSWTLQKKKKGHVYCDKLLRCSHSPDAGITVTAVMLGSQQQQSCWDHSNSSHAGIKATAVMLGSQQQQSSWDHSNCHSPSFAGCKRSKSVLLLLLLQTLKSSSFLQWHFTQVVVKLCYLMPNAVSDTSKHLSNCDTSYQSLFEILNTSC